MGEKRRAGLGDLVGSSQLSPRFVNARTSAESAPQPEPAGAIGGVPLLRIERGWVVAAHNRAGMGHLLVERRDLQVAHHEAAVTDAVAKLDCPEGLPVLNAQAAGALLRLLEGARERRRNREGHRKAS